MNRWTQQPMILTNRIPRDQREKAYTKKWAPHGMEIPTLPNKYTYTRQSQQWFTLSFPAWWCYSLIHIHAHRWINLEVNCMRCDWHCHQRIFNTHKICVLHSHIQHTRVFPHFVCSTSKYFWVKFIFVSRLYFACMFCTHISASLFNDAVFFFLL